ncbi:MAG: SlyX family protein [Devosia sp.]
MNETEELKRRIETLEELAAFQERAIEELSGTVADQCKQIAALRRDLANLGAQLAEVEAAGTTPQREPPPPHY